MKQIEWRQYIQVSLVAGGIAALFIAIYSFIYLGVMRHWWDAPSEGVVVAMSALIALIVPVGPIWYRLARVKFGGLEIDLKEVAAEGVRLPIDQISFRPLEGVNLNVDLNSLQSIGLGPSYIKTVLPILEETISQKPQAKLLTLNIDSGPEWWSTRVFLVAALLEQFTEIQWIVFVENCGGPDDCFIGFATPQAVRRAFAAKYKSLALPRALDDPSPLDLEGVYQSTPAPVTLQTAGENFVMWFVQTGRIPEDQQKKKITKDRLRRWLGTALERNYVEWHDGPPPEWMLKKILNQREPIVALVQCGRLKLIVDRDDLTAKLTAQGIKLP